jgi:hypothetical protein
MLQWNPRFAAFAVLVVLIVIAFALGIVSPDDLFW